MRSENDKEFFKRLRQMRGNQRDEAFHKGCKYMISVFEHLIEKEKSRPLDALKRLKVLADLQNTDKDKRAYNTLTLSEIKSDYKLILQI